MAPPALTSRVPGPLCSMPESALVMVLAVKLMSPPALMLVRSVAEMFWVEMNRLVRSPPAAMVACLGR